VFRDSTTPVVNAGPGITSAEKGRKRKNPVGDVDGTENIGTRGRGSKKRKTNSGAAALPQTVYALAMNKSSHTSTIKKIAYPFRYSY
jgi:hypothetical protein